MKNIFSAQNKKDELIRQSATYLMQKRYENSVRDSEV